MIVLIRPNGSASERVSIARLPRWKTADAPHRLIVPMAEVNRRAVESALILCAGNQILAASCLQISRSTIARYVRMFRAENLQA